MAQTFEPSSVLGVKLVLLALLVASALAVVVIRAQRAANDPVGIAAAQPVPFSHKHHVGDVGLDCRYCHAAVETAASPGMPSAALCLGCHSQLYADQAMLAPLHESVRSGRPIGWTHVDKLPDYVYFDHSVHVARGVACMQCHGRIDQMPLVGKVQRFEMRWCLACHEHPEGRLSAADQVFRMPAAVLARSRAGSALPLETRQRLTDCSTCHR